LAEWDDPWPKPAYLFALVAGDLRAHSAEFTTASGAVDLNIWVRPGDEDRCAYAMDSLIRSMRWDEEVYGREYDLDVFNIVAVDDFNMGAMENKGLNIFNSATSWPARKPRRTTIMPGSRRSSRMNISTTGPATGSPAATGSSCA
jgi:aminopeptidase N